MMDADTERALIAAVVATPDDDTPRLAYADFLDEHDRPERAQLIRVQCQIARLQTEEKELLGQQETWEEIGEQLKKFGLEHLRTIGTHGVSKIKFHRGFPEEFEMVAQDFLDHRHEVAAITPIRRLTLNNCRNEALRGIISSLHTHNLQSLKLSCYPIQPNTIRALANLPHLEHLRELEIKAMDFGPQQCTALLAAPFLSRLERLSLRAGDHNEMPVNNDVRDRLAAALTPGVAKIFQWGNHPYGEHFIREVHERRQQAAPGAGR